MVSLGIVIQVNAATTSVNEVRNREKVREQSATSFLSSLCNARFSASTICVRDGPEKGGGGGCVCVCVCWGGCVRDGLEKGGGGGW